MKQDKVDTSGPIEVIIPLSVMEKAHYANAVQLNFSGTEFFLDFLLVSPGVKGMQAVGVSRVVMSPETFGLIAKGTDWQKSYEAWVQNYGSRIHIP